LVCTQLSGSVASAHGTGKKEDGEILAILSTAVGPGRDGKVAGWLTIGLIDLALAQAEVKIDEGVDRDDIGGYLKYMFLYSPHK
jgi:hypothetical protein